MRKKTVMRPKIYFSSCEVFSAPKKTQRFLTRSLAHFAIAHFPVAGGTLTVVAAFGVLTDLRTGAVHLALIDV